PQTKRVLRSTGSYTISTSSPESRTADVAGMTVGFFSCSFFSGGDVEVMRELVALQCFERLAEGHRLFVHQERHNVALGTAHAAGVNAGLGIHREGTGTVVVERAVACEAATLRLEAREAPRNLMDRDRRPRPL